MIHISQGGSDLVSLNAVTIGSDPEIDPDVYLTSSSEEKYSNEDKDMKDQLLKG